MQVSEPLCSGDGSDDELYCRAYTTTEEKKRVHNTVRLHKLLGLATIVLAPVWITLFDTQYPSWYLY